MPALALGFGMLRMPQSPRWLVMSGDDFAARATLAKIRVDDPDTIDRELEEIKESLDDKPGAWSELLQPVVKAALFVGVGLAILQQVTGINTVIYYAPTIVEFTGVNSSAGAILAAVGVGVINVGFTVLALRLLDRAGRRTMLMVGVSGMVISLFALGAAFIGGGGSTIASVVAIVSLMTYVASFAISLGPIFWLLNAEIYPLAVRSKAAGLGTMANWTFNFIVSLTFLLLIEAAGPHRRLLDLRRHRHPHPLVLLEVRPRDQGQAPRGHPGLLPGPGRQPQAHRVDTLRRCGSTRSSPRGGRPSRSSSSRRRRRRRPSSSTRPRASWSHLEPDFVSVTYGAGGSTRDGTVEITKALKDDLGFETMAHLSCVGETTEGLAGTLDRIAAAGIENVFALRGDPPRGEGDFVQPEGGLGSAAELAAFIAAGWDFAIGGACFPEVHPEAPDLETDLSYLKTKVDSGAGFLITQLFFDNQVYFDFVRAARAAGIEVPILAGVIPVASFAQTKRICDLCDATIPAPLEAGLRGGRRRPRAGVRAGRRLRRPAVRRAADRRRAGHPLLRAQPGAGDPRRAGRPARLAALGADARRRRRPDRQRRLSCHHRWPTGGTRGRSCARAGSKKSGGASQRTATG